jgi:EAL domain-containing protein (putative c-di-GMP-specific phosphodiesterase class I)/methyl-accepting chemotaxis protein
MSLSKQLYIIISLIFFMIFTGNFIISVNNTKEYLETESITKAQDTATSLGMSLKPYMKNKQDPQIESILNAIANRGFYKQIRLDDVHFQFTQKDLLDTIENLPKDSWKVSNVEVDNLYGKLEKSGDDEAFLQELADLENVELSEDKKSATNDYFIFTPKENGVSVVAIEVRFQISNGVDTLSKSVKLNLSKSIYEVNRAEKFDYVPQWFINLIPIHLGETKSEINDGWNTTAVIYVSANAGDAYAKLYSQAKGAILYALIAFSISILFLIIFLRFILQPLKNIEKLATSIAQGKFELIQNLPWTTELKNVSIAMNDMSSKIEGIIKKLNTNLENMTKKLLEDELTSLHLKQSFETDIKSMFISKEMGYVFVIKLDDLGSYAKNHTNEEVNQFLVKFADILKNISSKATAYRFFGSEFVMIVKGADEKEVQEITQKLKTKFDHLSKEITKDEIAHIGGTHFNLIGTSTGMLASATEAYEKAKLIGPNEVFIQEDNESARDMQQWKELVFDVIDNKKFMVEYIGATYGLSNETKNQLLLEEAFTKAKDNKGEFIPIGTFVSIAEKYDKIIDFDKMVIQTVIEHIKTTNIKHSIAINLSFDSVFDIKFKNWLKEIILENSSIAPQLVLSVSAYGVAKNVEKFKYFIEAIHQAGAKIIIKRFETKFIPLNEIKNFNLDYIRLARDYTFEIYKDSSKLGFVESMQELAKLLNIKVLAENVTDDKDLKIVKDLGLYGASR